MAIDPIVKPLLSVALFQGLKPLQITEIARCSDRILYRSGDRIIADGEAGDAAVLIVDGVAVRISGPVMEGPDEVVPIGALVGEMAMFIEVEHSSTVVARTPVKALRISRSDMHHLMAKDVALGEHFVAVIARRLSSFAATLREIDGMLSGAELSANASNVEAAEGGRAPSASPALH